MAENMQFARVLVLGMGGHRGGKGWPRIVGHVGQNLQGRAKPWLTARYVTAQGGVWD